MPKLTPLWTLLETRPSRAAVMAEWRSVADGCLPVVERLLVPLDEPATIYPDPHGGLPMRVVHHRDGSVVAVSREEGGGRLLLTAGDVVLYQVDLRRLRKAISDALNGLAIARTPVDGRGRRLHVGNWEPKTAAAFPVHVLFCMDAGALRQAVANHVARNEKPGSILMTPTRANWDADIEGLARSHRLMLTPLDEVLSVDGEGLCETPAWEQYRQAFCQMVELTLPSNYRNKKPVPMRATRATDIERLEKALEQHIIAARDHAHSLCDRGLDPVLLPRPYQKDLVNELHIDESAVSRCLNDKRAKVLKMLWDTADSLEAVMNFKRRR